MTRQSQAAIASRGQKLRRLATSRASSGMQMTTNPWANHPPMHGDAAPLRGLGPVVTELPHPMLFGGPAGAFPTPADRQPTPTTITAPPMWRPPAPLNMTVGEVTPPLRVSPTFQNRNPMEVQVPRTSVGGVDTQSPQYTDHASLQQMHRVFQVNASRRVVRDAEENQPFNTNIAYSRVQHEWIGYCETFPLIDHWSHGLIKHFVTEDQAFLFLFYTSHRQKRTHTKNHHYFDVDDYRRVMREHPPDVDTMYGDPARTYPAISVFEGARAALADLANRQLVELQGMIHANPRLNAELYHRANAEVLHFKNSPRLKQLAKIIKERKVQRQRLNCVEKVGLGMEPYGMIKYFHAIEREFWEHNGMTKSHHVSSLRDRFVYLETLQRVSRGEALENEELSDIFGFFWQLPGHPDKWYCSTSLIRVGKSNAAARGVVNYTRCIRHADPTMCAVGARALYFFARFRYTGELGEIDMTENENWWFIKSLTDHIRKNNTEAISLSGTYAKSINRVFEKLGIDAKHKIHFGRAEAPARLELQGLSSPEIKILGNWDQDTQEAVYSAKMPIGAMLVAAGFENRPGGHYNPRVRVEPPDSLKQQIFPELESLEAQIAVGHADKVTARGFLGALREFRTIILQDAAVLLHQGRRHRIYEDHPVFQGPVFQQFQQQVVAAISEPRLVDAEGSRALATVAPVVEQRLKNVECSQAACLEMSRGVDTKLSSMQGQLDFVYNFVSHMNRFPGQAQSPLMARQEPMSPPVVWREQVPQRAPFAGLGAASPSRATGTSTAALSMAAVGDSLEELVGSPTRAADQTNAQQVFGRDLRGSSWNDYPVIRNTYLSLKEILSDWRGDHGSAFAPFHGIKNLEEVKKHTWRACYADGDNRRFRRYKRIAVFVEGTIDANLRIAHSGGGDMHGIEAEVIELLEQWYIQHNRSLTPFDNMIGKRVKTSMDYNLTLSPEDRLDPSQRREPYPILDSLRQQTPVEV